MALQFVSTGTGILMLRLTPGPVEHMVQELEKQ